MNELVILPDIEKRLEAFVRMGHSFVVFPGGAGTMEEILYLLGLVMLEENQDIPMPLLFAAPSASRQYFETLDAFIRNTLGEEATKYYEIIIDRPDQVAQLSLRNLNKTLSYRRRVDESYAYNWNLTIPETMQQPFDPTHEAMAELNLDPALPNGELIAQLRRAFSGIVAGNVKAEGIRRIVEHGPFQLHGDPRLMGALDTMLQDFVAHGRMKISTADYQPCYQLVADSV